jgi:hypothetical protein
MYLIKNLYIQQSHGILKQYNTSEIVPENLRSNVTINTKLYLKVYNTDDLKIYILDLSLLFLETQLGQLFTWMDIEDELTDQLILGYTLQSYLLTFEQSIIINELTTYDVMSDYIVGRFKVEYTSIDNPYMRNNKYQIFNLPDLVISKSFTSHIYDIEKSEFETSDLTKMIPIINGRFTTCLYESSSKELFIKDGSKLCRNTSISKNIHPDILLLDTHRFNGHSIILLKDCVYKFNRLSNSNATDFNSQMTITLPEQYNLDYTTPWVVIDGIPYFNTFINKLDKHNIQFYPNRTIFKESKLYKQWLIGESLLNTEIYEINNTLDNLFKTELQQDSSFIILFNVPNIYIHESICVPFIKYQNVVTPNFNHGLLFKKNMHNFKSYTYQEGNNNQAILFMKDSGEHYQFDEDLHGSAFNSVSEFDCAHNDLFKDFADSQYSLLSFSHNQIYA